MNAVFLSNNDKMSPFCKKGYRFGVFIKIRRGRRRRRR